MFLGGTHILGLLKFANIPHDNLSQQSRNIAECLETREKVDSGTMVTTLQALDANKYIVETYHRYILDFQLITNIYVRIAYSSCI